MSENPNTPAQNIWQNQPVEGIRMSIDEIRNRAGKFERTIRWRNAREYVGSLIAAALFGYFFYGTHVWVFRIAYVLFIAGLAWIVVQLRRKGAAKSLPAEMGASPALQYFRAELERQREVVKNVWPWYLAPLVPGFVVLTVGYVRSVPFPKGVVAALIMDTLVTALFFAVWKMNERAARCLQRKIDELHAAER
jgi:hypothetical protein